MDDSQRDSRFGRALRALDYVLVNGFEPGQYSRGVTFVDGHLQNKDIICKVCLIHGEILEFTSPYLQNDKEVVLLAVSNCGRSWQYASEELRKDEEVMNKTQEHWKELIDDAMYTDDDNEIEHNEIVKKHDEILSHIPDNYPYNSLVEIEYYVQRKQGVAHD